MYICVRPSVRARVCVCVIPASCVAAVSKKFLWDDHGVRSVLASCKASEWNTYYTTLWIQMPYMAGSSGIATAFK